MLFNSLSFFIFFPVVTLIYFLLPHKYRWFHLLAASCYFYMSFVPVYIFVLFSTIIVDYFAGIFIEKSTGKKRTYYFTMAVIANLLVLCVFKYYNFFISNTTIVIKSIGSRAFSLPFLNMLLPLGLSFHTFQALSYIIEVKRGNVKAEKHFGIYALFVMFYPQLVAGPIERPQNLLYQFHEKKTFDGDRVIVGLKIMLWGFIKKLVIADRLAFFVNEVYAHTDRVGTPQIWLTVFLFFPFQVYCDFSGYSTIALGAAKVMGFDLMENFRTPFSSLTTSELWNRWHISLSTWFRDYLYQPLVIYFRDYGKWSVVIGLMITFFLSGLWHGAGWNFIIYGLLQGSVITIEFLLGVKSIKLAKTSFGRIGGTIITYLLFAFSLIFFRVASIRHSAEIIKKMFWRTDFHIYSIPSIAPFNYILSVFSVIVLLSFEKKYATKYLYQKYELKREVVISSFMIVTIVVLGVFHNISFIYFQF